VILSISTSGIAILSTQTRFYLLEAGLDLAPPAASSQQATTSSHFQLTPYWQKAPHQNYQY